MNVLKSSRRMSFTRLSAYDLVVGISPVESRRRKVLFGIPTAAAALSIVSNFGSFKSFHPFRDTKIAEPGVQGRIVPQLSSAALVWHVAYSIAANDNA